MQNITTDIIGVRHRGGGPTVTLRSGAAAMAIGVLALTGCGGGGEPEAESTGSDTGSAAATTPATGTDTATEGSQRQVLTVGEPWMKAADSEKTAVFGTLTNDGDTAVTITGANAEGISESTELHETVMDEGTGSTTMREMTDPLVIEPGGTVNLEPGGDHIMLMDLTCAPMAGQTLSIELTFEGGETQSVELPVRDYQGAQEEYAHEDGEHDHGEHDHAGHDHGELGMCQEAS